VRRIKVLLLGALLTVASAAGAIAFTAPPAPTNTAFFCTNTKCDEVGQKTCSYLNNANCGQSPAGCLGWVACSPPSGGGDDGGDDGPVQPGGPGDEGGDGGSGGE